MLKLFKKTTGPNIAWVVPKPMIGGGGYRTILQRAEYLQMHYNAICDLYIHPTDKYIFDKEEVLKSLQANFNFVPHDVFYQVTVQKKYDCIIATSFPTAEYVAIQECNNKFYFVQDYEPWFFPIGYHYLCAKKSYDLGLKPIVLGRWLKTLLSEKYDVVGFSDFGVDTTTYNCSSHIKKEKAICTVWQPDKPRRDSELLIEVLSEIATRFPDLTIYTFGCNEFREQLLSIPTVKHLGLLSPEELSELYNKCTIGLSFSLSNPSRIPFEMLACGLPVVELDMPNNKLDFPEGCIKYAEPDCMSVVNTVASFMENQDLLLEAGKEASLAMAHRTIENENREFAEALIDSLETDKVSDNIDSLLTCEEKIWLTNKFKQYLEYDVLRGSRISCKIIPFEPQHYSKLRIMCAVWHKSDQSDLQWVNCFVQDAEIAFDCKISKAEATEISNLNLHFYADREGQSPEFIGSATVSFIYDQNNSKESSFELVSGFIYGDVRIESNMR